MTSITRSPGLNFSGFVCVAVVRVCSTMENAGDSRGGSGQLSGCAADFRNDMDVLSLSVFLGDNGVPSDVCEVFEGK